MNRRELIGASLGMLVPSWSAVKAQSYPTRPVRILAGFPAGGTTDVVARVFAQWLTDRLGINFIVENRPGAATNIATDVAAHAPPDGYTVLIATPANAINATLYTDLQFDFLRDFAPVVSLIRSPYVLEVIPSVPVRTVPELIAYAKANPGKLNIGSFGMGSGSHLANEMFKMMAGIQMVHVPYRGSAPMVTDLLGGQVQVAIDNLPASIEHIKAGNLRALAVTTEKRTPVLPDVPALADFLPGYEASSWLALAVPRRTPNDVIDTLYRQVAAGLANPAIRAQLEGLGATILGGSPEATAALFAAETERWAKVVRFAGVKP